LLSDSGRNFPNRRFLRVASCFFSGLARVEIHRLILHAGPSKKVPNTEFISHDVRKEYLRWLESFGPVDVYSSRNSVGVHETLRAHFLIVDYFIKQRGGIGGVGPRDKDLLHSAVYRPFTCYGGKEKWATIFEKCATLLFGLVKDHPFHDANKRTALLVTVFYLDKLHRTPTIKQRELENFIVDIADNRLDKYPRFRELQKKTPDAEVLFIADFLRRNTREVDKKSRTVTFHELNGILRSHGFELRNTYKNFVDLVRIESQKTLFGFGPTKVRETKIAQIGFPGWKSQVGRGAIKTVRDTTGLTPERGYDSQVFFGDADSLNLLLDEYAEPLRRLAYR
jgi:death-on-curing family protein